MNTNDLMSTLREADPVERIDLARLGDDDFAGLRRGVLATELPRASAAKPRRVRRSILAGGLSLALIGGGAAAYASRDGWGPRQPELQCLQTWADRGNLGESSVVYGPSFSDDPIADCEYYAKESGVQPIEDPVAIWSGGDIVVGPLQGAPNGAADGSEGEAAGSSVGPRSARDKALAELSNSLGDYVDGGKSQCFTASTGKAFVTKELARLGLDDMKAEVETEVPEPVEGQEELPGAAPDVCAFFFIGTDDNGDSDNTVIVRPNASPDPTIEHDPNDKTASVDPAVWKVRDGLREQVADQCLSLSDAEKATEEVLGSESHWPTGVTQDDKSDCPRIDMVVGGDIQIFLYGPKVAKP